MSQKSYLDQKAENIINTLNLQSEDKDYLLGILEEVYSTGYSDGYNDGEIDGYEDGKNNCNVW